MASPLWVLVRAVLDWSNIIIFSTIKCNTIANRCNNKLPCIIWVAKSSEVYVAMYFLLHCAHKAGQITYFIRLLNMHTPNN